MFNTDYRLDWQFSSAWHQKWGSASKIASVRYCLCHKLLPEAVLYVVRILTYNSPIRDSHTISLFSPMQDSSVRMRPFCMLPELSIRSEEDSPSSFPIACTEAALKSFSICLFRYTMYFSKVVLQLFTACERLRTVSAEFTVSTPVSQSAAVMTTLMFFLRFGCWKSATFTRFNITTMMFCNMPIQVVGAIERRVGAPFYTAVHLGR
jgi:hypothetical protein